MSADDIAGTGALSTVRNAVRVLTSFSLEERELGVSELARRLGLGRSTVHRLLVTLAADGLLEQNPASGKYRLGLRTYELGMLAAAHMDVREAARPVLARLRDETAETVQLAVLDGREVVYVERLETTQTVRIFGHVGHRNQAHCTSTGKVLLAALPDTELDRLLDGWVLDAKTPYTITDPARLRAELARVRRAGFAENVNETGIGVASVAAPIRDATGAVVAAVSVAGPVMRVDGRSLRRFSGMVMEAAGDVSRKLGYGLSAARTRKESSR
jgi:DNA-binding IclR family transcriptional regulator